MRPLALVAALASLVGSPAPGSSPEPATEEPSTAREWNEQVLLAVRNDFARPTVHARNLFHTSIAMWDAWAAYDDWAEGYLVREKLDAIDVAAARREALSHAVYRILVARFASSPGAATSLASFDEKMQALGYDATNERLDGDTPAALGNRVAAAVLAFGAADGSNESNGYANRFYAPVNGALIPAFPGNPLISDPGRWQPLSLEFFVGQSGFPFPLGVPPFLSPEWGTVTPFALAAEDRTVHVDAAGNAYWLYHDPGPPPVLDGEGDAEYRSGFQSVLEASALLDPGDGALLDIGPGARGDNSLGTNDGDGHALNPATGLPYAPNVVPAGDYYRVLAEFWADGPDSETPPGHWFTIANYVSDHAALERRIGGVGPLVDPLEWDVKLYLALGGAVHDAAVAAWGAKGWYDYVRPISAIRYMADHGQSSDPGGLSYHPHGLELVPGLVEVVTAESARPGARHAHLVGEDGAGIGKIAARAWRGPDFIADPDTTSAGVGWILVESWWPYQRPTFVTPPFAGYVSGHSTFSRAAAEVLTLFTGDAYFPGGYGEFHAPRDEFLVFEDGPSVDVNLQWATYRDAADESGISRIYGGIHPPIDDVPGRRMGAVIGPDAYALARTYWGPWPTLELQRAFLGTRDGRLWASGQLQTGVYGKQDVFEPTAGLELTISSGDAAARRLELRHCWRLRGGQVLCWSQAERAFAFFRPDAAGKRVVQRFWLWIPGPGAEIAPDGPIRLTIGERETGRVRAGQAGVCRPTRQGLLCRRAGHARGPRTAASKP